MLMNSLTPQRNSLPMANTLMCVATTSLPCVHAKSAACIRLQKWATSVY